MVVNLHSATIRPVRLPFFTGGELLFRIVRIGHRIALWGRNTDPRAADNWATYSIGLSARPPARKLGDAAYFVPAGRSNRLWLISSGGPHHAATAREITQTGQATSATIPLPAPSYLSGSTRFRAGPRAPTGGAGGLGPGFAHGHAQGARAPFRTRGATRGDLDREPARDPPGRLLIVDGGSGSRDIVAAPPGFGTRARVHRKRVLARREVPRHRLGPQPAESQTTRTAWGSTRAGHHRFGDEGGADTRRLRCRRGLQLRDLDLGRQSCGLHRRLGAPGRSSPTGWGSEAPSGCR